MQQPDDAMRLKPMLGFVHEKHAAPWCRFALKSRDQKASRSSAESAQRNPVVVMKRDRTAAEGHRMHIQHRADIAADVDAQFGGSLADDSQRLAELILGVATEGLARFAGSLRQRRRRIGPFLGNPV